MAEWENGPLDLRTKEKEKKKQRVNLESPRPMTARLIKPKGTKLELAHVCMVHVLPRMVQPLILEVSPKYLKKLIRSCLPFNNYSCKLFLNCRCRSQNL